MADPIEARFQRLEGYIEALAEKQNKLDDVIVLLTEAQIKTEQRFQEISQRFRETDERFRQTDERIDKLVSAIGEFLRRSNGKPQ